MCVCVCVWRGGLWSDTDDHCREGGDPKLELSKDQRKLLCLVPKRVDSSSDSEDYSGFLVVVSMTLRLMRKDSGLFHSVW